MIATIIFLYVLATIDMTFCGYRAAMGHNGLIDKSQYYRNAMKRGAILGQIPICCFALAAGAVVIADASLFEVMLSAWQYALMVFLPYAGIILLTLLINLIPSVDLRSLSSVLIFGPLTLLRPVVLVTGVLLGVYLTGIRWEIIALAIATLPMFLFFDKFPVVALRTT